ncbi:hypothetical protein RRG08_064665 [Elysia crispata]|uniref:Uncharacterized protein n=1 Tax=Elysia crispata TaxID=231223 RepID=A0AAE1B9D1_9GAST|nr:hypothetical protein RRG08_064665 [Elysia crispata]
MRQVPQQVEPDFVSTADFLRSSGESDFEESEKLRIFSSCFKGSGERGKRVRRAYYGTWRATRSAGGGRRERARE